jgi:phytoene synthase
MNEATNVLRQKSQSFYWAGKLLPARILQDVATLYAFCRMMDDAIDEENKPENVCAAKTNLRGVYPHIAELMAHYDIPDAVMQAFLDTLLRDIPPVNTKNLTELLHFAYGAAGTVGIMMSHVLGRTKPEIIYHAIDLGIAMQLVNIARDVKEDRQQLRFYLPEGFTPEALIDYAEPYFQSGIEAIAFLPFSVRPSIMTAALVYRAIGQKILANPKRAMQHRVYVPAWQKALLTLRAYVHVMTTKKSPMQHDATLHQHLTGLPCVHSS